MDFRGILSSTSSPEHQREKKMQQMVDGRRNIRKRPTVPGQCFEIRLILRGWSIHFPEEIIWWTDLDGQEVSAHQFDHSSREFFRKRGCIQSWHAVTRFRDILIEYQGDTTRNQCLKGEHHPRSVPYWFPSFLLSDWGNRRCTDDVRWSNKSHSESLPWPPNRNNAKDEQCHQYSQKFTLLWSWAFYRSSKTFDRFVSREDSAQVSVVRDSSWCREEAFESSSANHDRTSSSDRNHRVWAMYGRYLPDGCET